MTQMGETNPRRMESIALSRLRPTQLTVGMLEVKQKRKRLRALEKRPAEIVNFILETPIRVVLGPKNRAYVIDHHHLALALLKENFQTAPMEIEADLSHLESRSFWKRMEEDRYLHLYNAKGKRRPLRCLPASLRALKDDPYRSLAGFVREAGGFLKTQAPFAEFAWANFFRRRVDEDAVRDRFEKTVDKCVGLACSAAAAELPGFVGTKTKKRADEG
jgi:hypothetical protein